MRLNIDNKYIKIIEYSHTVYKERLDIREVLLVTADIKMLIGSNFNEYEIKEVTIKQGMTTFK